MEQRKQIIGLTINGLPVADMATYEVELSDLDNEGYRSIITGKLIRNRIRKDVVKISLVFNAVDIPRAGEILRALGGETFTVGYYDVVNQAQRNITMYAGAKTFGYVPVQNGPFKVMTQALTFNLIEV